MKKIMFVDDDQDFLQAQKLFFEHRGFIVLTADSTDNALELLKNEKPDILVLDLMMENYDSGFTLAYRISKLNTMKDVPIIMLSGVAAETGARFDSSESEMNQWSQVKVFLNKPVAQEKLVRIIVENIGQK